MEARHSREGGRAFGDGDEAVEELLEIPRSFVEAVTMTGSSRNAQGHSTKWKDSGAHTFIC